jgi:mxaA protein
MAVTQVRTIEPLVQGCRAALLAALAALTLPLATAQAQPGPSSSSIAVSVQQPRAFGYVIGDTLEQRISLLAPPGVRLDPRSLPRAGRQGLWLELSPPRLTADERNDGTRYRLSLDYQIINVPQQVLTIDLPAVALAFGARDGRLTAMVDEWPITVAPITPTYVLARAGLTQTQPDAPPSAPDTASYRRLTILWIACVLAIVGGAIVQRRGILWLRHGARPFARAAREIAKLSRLPQERATYRRGLQCLHRAFDAAAGHAVFGDRLTPLFTARPELLRLRAEIEQFYAASQREFFGARPAAESLREVLALATRCRDAEAAAVRGSVAGGPAASDRRPHAVH